MFDKPTFSKILICDVYVRQYLYQTNTNVINKIGMLRLNALSSLEKFPNFTKSC